MGVQAHAGGVDQYIGALGDAGGALPGDEAGLGSGVIPDDFCQGFAALAASVDYGDGSGPGQRAFDADASRRAARPQQADGLAGQRDAGLRQRLYPV